MNKSVIGTIAIISLAVFLVFGILAALMSMTIFKGTSIDGDFNFGSMAGEDFTIEFDESYKLDGIDTIQIDVVSSDIYINNSTSTIDVKFSGNGRTAKSGVELIVEEKGSMLHIYVKYPTMSNTWFMDSQLNVDIPAEFDGDIIINGVSSDIDIMYIDNDINLLRVDTTSGDTDAQLSSVNTLNIDTTSGDSTVNAIINEEFTGDSVSGDFDVVTIGENAKLIDVDTTSGRVEVTFVNPCKTKIDTVSGDVSLTYENEEKLDLHFDSVSGDLDGSYSTSSDGIYVEVDTTSGDLNIN